MGKMEPKHWWQRQFKGNIRIMTMEIVFAFFVAFGIANLVQNRKYGLLLVPVVFVVVLVILLRLTRKDDRSPLD